MKRVMNNSDIKVIHVAIDIEYSQGYVAASGQEEFQKMPSHPSIKKENKKPDEWLDELNDLAESIFVAIHGRGFYLAKEWYSKKSYTYYYRFQPTDAEGNIIEETIEIQVELRDHRSKTHHEHGELASNLFLKTYYLEDNQYSNRFNLLKAIWNLLDELKKGNFDVLN